MVQVASRLFQTSRVRDINALCMLACSMSSLSARHAAAPAAARCRSSGAATTPVVDAARALCGASGRRCIRGARVTVTRRAPSRPVARRRRPERHNWREIRADRG